MDRGVDGFRIDVAHGLVKEEGLRDRVITPEEQAAAKDANAMVVLRTVDEPMWDQPGVHEIYRGWRRILDEYDGDRMAVAEAWTRTTEAMARYVRDDELHQAFNFHWLVAEWSAAELGRVIEETLAALGEVGGEPTWVLSNHDVSRHPTRYGGGRVGLARARAATLVSLALPGSAYLYQGEELGLEDVDVAPEHRQDPSWFRTGKPGRDGCRVPIPWAGDRPPYEFGPGSGQPWIPQPAEWAELTVAAQQADPDSTLAFYRKALAARRKHAADAGDEVMVEVEADALTVRRGELTVVLNCGATPVPMPPGELLIASAAVDGRPSRRTRRCGSGVVEGRVVAGQLADEVGQLPLGPVAELLVEQLAPMVRDVLHPAGALVGDLQQAGPPVLGVRLALDQAELRQVVHLAADRALVDVEQLHDRGGAHRAVVVDVRQDEVRRRLQRLVHRAGAHADHPAYPPDQHSDLLLEVADRVGSGHRDSPSFVTVVRSGTSRMASTQIRASNANGTDTRKMWPMASPNACS